MTNKKIFKAYDIRGIYPSDIEENIVYDIGKIIAKKLFKNGQIVIAHDTRLSSPSLYKKIISGIKNINSDIKIIDAGLTTTPMLYFLTAKHNASIGIMVTASHNPKEYNGLKIINKEGEMIGGEEILSLMT